MSEPLILILVLIASAVSITALVLLNRWLGGWTPARLDSLQAAAGHLADDIVGFEAGEGALAVDARAALVEERGGRRLGLVLARGDRCVTRALAPGELIAVTREGATLTLHLADFTLNRVVTTLQDETTAMRWADRAGRFTSRQRDGHAEPA